MGSLTPLADHSHVGGLFGRYIMDGENDASWA